MYLCLCLAVSYLVVIYMVSLVCLKLVIITVAGGKRVVGRSLLFLISIDGMLRSRICKGSVCGEFSKTALRKVGVP